jgi:NifB/MoaA-like Fe-S oxidoreductase
VAVAALDPDRASRQPAPAVVASVEPGSIGEDLGFEPGDQLLSINGVRPRDLIDYRYLIVEEELHLEIRDAAGALHQVDLEKDEDEGLGLAFTEALFDGLRQCSNACAFCFIDQQPPGHRSRSGLAGSTIWIKGRNSHSRRRFIPRGDDSQLRSV